MPYAIQNINNLPFGNIIGAPMKAAVEAQSLAAKTTIDFIKEVGFQPPGNDFDSDPFFPGDDTVQNADMGTVRNVTFKYSVEGVPNDDGETTPTEATLNVPILTIIPIPYLRIDEMTIDFVAKITEMFSFQHRNASTTRKKGGGGFSVGWGPLSVGAKASYSSTHTSSSARSSRYQTELTMNVNVRAVQDDIPKGLEKVLSILEGIIQEAERTEPA